MKVKTFYQIMGLYIMVWVIILQLMNFIDEIIENIIRPIREQYRPNRLGPSEFRLTSVISGPQLQITRSDDSILNRQGLRLHLSCFEIRNRGPLPYVVYLHANNGCRVQGLSYLKALLESEMNVLLFDCAGSGVSEGEYVSLGVRESEDLEAVVAYLAERRQANNICLWGRSMGAVTALLYASRNKKQIKCCVYDSPFRSLKKLIKQLASNRTGLPQFIFKPLLPIINNRLKEKCGWNFEDLHIKKFVQSIQVPGLFITSKNDSMVSCQHSQKLFNLYGGPKQIQYICCSHHQNRPDDIIRKSIHFMKSAVFKASQAQSMRKLHSIFSMSSSSLYNSPKSMTESLFLGSATTKNGKVSLANLRIMTEASMTMSAQQSTRNNNGGGGGQTSVMGNHNSRIKENGDYYHAAQNGANNNVFKKKIDDVKLENTNTCSHDSVRNNMEAFKNKLVVRQYFSKPNQQHPKGIKLLSKPSE